MRTIGVGIVALIVVAVVSWGWSSGRPPSLDHAAFGREADGVASLVAEGRLLAGLVADGRGYPRATRVRAEDIAEALRASATTLQQARVARGDRARAPAVASVATQGAQLLGKLASHPGDRGTARSTDRRLRDAAHELDRIEVAS